MRPFVAHLNHEFCERDFLESPVWATYYEPDEIDYLLQLGFDRNDVERAIALVRSNDELSFPLPSEAAAAPLQYLYLGIRATTRGGTRLTGFITGPCLGVFHKGKAYHFNAALRSHAVQASIELATALGEKSVFPMQVEVMATGEHTVETLW